MRTREHATPVATASHTGLTFILILSGLMAFTSLSTDIYLPAMPTMAEDLHGNVELTITGFLIGFTIAQLIWGPISDHMALDPGVGDGDCANRRAIDWRANYSPEHLALYFLAAGGDWCADVYLLKLAARNIAGREAGESLFSWCIS